jgi:hypothetical protein
MNVRNRKLSIIGGAILALTVLAGAAYAVQVDVSLDPNAAACLDSPPVFTEVNALCNVIEPIGGRVTCRLRNVTLGTPAADPAVAWPVITINLRQWMTPWLFPPPGSSSGHVFRVCANNNVQGQRVKVQLIINGR